MNKEINHDQISSVDQIDQFKWTVRVIEGGKFGQSFKKTFKHGGKFGQSFGPGPGFRFWFREILNWSQVRGSAQQPRTYVSRNIRVE